MGSVHLNEYDSYLAHTAELLSADADSFKIAAYVPQVVRADMGISNFPEEPIVEFALAQRQLTAWRATAATGPRLPKWGCCSK
jgi:hypothetical protein